MEQSISSLTFRGSIIEAIGEAKRQKKLFVVYISGDNPESVHLEESVWNDLKVGESLSKYCVLLHILEGSNDAAQFYKIYPQKPAPCITAIGYNGAQLWQDAGSVCAEVLASTLENLWLSIHIQETTATFLSAALASKNLDQLDSGASDLDSGEQGSSSRMDFPSSSVEKQKQAGLLKPEIIEETKTCGHEVKEQNLHRSDKVSTRSVPNESKVVEESTFSGDTKKESLNPLDMGVKTDFSDSLSPETEENSDYLRVVRANEKTVAIENGKAKSLEFKELESKCVEVENLKPLEVQKADGSCSSTVISNDVHLNIRMPNGGTLQEKFSAMGSLRTVKEYVNGNQTSSIGAYDLAIPYPRKIFGDEDLSKTLSELGLFNRQAIIVVPRNQQASRQDRSSLPGQIDLSSSSGSREGYFAYIKRIFSYVNPFSYLGGGAGSADSAHESESNMWQYNPNPSLQNELRGGVRPYTGNSPGQNTTPTDGRSRKSKHPGSSRFGSNIHTLKHDDDDPGFGDRNAFWNGNSTQYGGDNDGK